MTFYLERTYVRTYVRTFSAWRRFTSALDSIFSFRTSALSVQVLTTLAARSDSVLVEERERERVRVREWDGEWREWVYVCVCCEGRTGREREGGRATRQNSEWYWAIEGTQIIYCVWNDKECQQCNLCREPFKLSTSYFSPILLFLWNLKNSSLWANKVRKYSVAFFFFLSSISVRLLLSSFSHILVSFFACLLLRANVFLGAINVRNPPDPWITGGWTPW